MIVAPRDTPILLIQQTFFFSARTILIERTKYYLVLMHLRTKFELDNSKFAEVRQFRRQTRKIQNVKKY